MSDLIRREDALALFAENDNVPTEIVRALIEDLPTVTVQAQIDDAIWAVALVVDEQMEKIGFCYGPNEFGRRAEMRNVIGEQLGSEAAAIRKGDQK
jgi:hypothetical protein